MQQTKKKMVLEHLVVHKMNTAADLKQVPLHCHSLHHQIHCLCGSPHVDCLLCWWVLSEQAHLHLIHFFA